MSQLSFIKNHLDKYGEISRNLCLRNYISRLSARIRDLEKMGYEFTTEKRGKDFIYKASKRSEVKSLASKPPSVLPQYAKEVISQQTLI